MTLLPGTAIDASDNFSVTLPVICGGLRQGLALPRQENVNLLNKRSPLIYFRISQELAVYVYGAGSPRYSGE